MRAAYIERTGPADSIRVGDLPRPEPQPGQILVRVGAVAFNPIDLYIRAGGVAMPLPFPYILGTDFAGVVEALGDGVSRFRVGDRVWGSNQGTVRSAGGGERNMLAVDEASRLSDPAPTSPTPRRRGAGPGGDHRAPWPVPARGICTGGRDGLHSRWQWRRRLDGHPDGQGRRRPQVATSAGEPGEARTLQGPGRRPRP